jgi:hypothetical protein
MFKVSKSYQNNWYKCEQNKTFVQKIMDNLDLYHDKTLETIPNTSFIGTLDSIEANTSRLMMLNGVKKTNILIVESNEAIGERHIDRGIPCHIGDLASFADDENDRTYSQPDNNWRNYKCIGWNFDTCGHVRTQGTQILAVLKKTNLVEGCVLTFTFCRSRISNDDHFHYQVHFMRALRTLVARKGMKVKVIERYYYSGDGNGNAGAPMEWSMVELY